MKLQLALVSLFSLAMPQLALALPGYPEMVVTSIVQRGEPDSVSIPMPDGTAPIIHNAGITTQVTFRLFTDGCTRASDFRTKLTVDQDNDYWLWISLPKPWENNCSRPKGEYSYTLNVASVPYRAHLYLANPFAITDKTTPVPQGAPTMLTSPTAPRHR